MSPAVSWLYSSTNLPQAINESYIPLGRDITYTQSLCEVFTAVGANIALISLYMGGSNAPVLTVNTLQQLGPCISRWCSIHALGPGPR